ncbi:MAG: DNA polymerase III subunit gamma/tau, partial [Candidatus Omnitrophica bacterium]|nr:DNA polymerase III subunit gamma/tau [Candidatus Omnitrophota bacterium]
GKTSLARILAKSLNCQKGPTLSPCENCTSCKEISESRSFDVIEIDGASNRGIEEIRSLRENVKFSPSAGKYKIYIIDEVHMLTTEAFNALLKTLEEPPEHVKFIFATTHPEKVIPTIISRCQRFDFHKISITKIIEKLDKISRAEKLDVDKDALFAIAKAASGSMRDAESILDQLSAFSKNKIKLSDVTDVLGMIEEDYLFEITDKIFQKDASGAIKLIDTLINEGKDTKGFIAGLIEHFRNLMIARIGGKSLESLLDLPPEIKIKVLEQSQQFLVTDLINSIEILVAAQEIARKIDSLHIPLEMAIAKLTSINSNPEPQLKKVLPQQNPKETGKENKPKIKQNPEDARQQSDSAATSQQTKEEDNPNDSVQMFSDVTFQEIKGKWSELINILSKIKMSVATFLQEGSLIKLEKNILTVGLPKEASLHKELLEGQSNRALIESSLSQLLDKDIKINFETTSDRLQGETPHGHAIKSTIDTFKGRLINHWHKQD